MEGSELGSCGRPLDEQRQVVGEKLAVAGLAAPSAGQLSSFAALALSA
jgi:hypothetical protein